MLWYFLIEKYFKWCYADGNELWKAVIASDLPPNKEVITHGENGFLFESGNKDNLAKVIREVFENSDTRER